MTTQPYTGGHGEGEGETEQELRRWIELCRQLKVGDASWAHPSFADLVAACGFYQPPAAWTHGGTQQPGRCFQTASEWAERAGWTYVEGSAFVPSAAPFSCIEHAWCLNDGDVADPSLPDGIATGYIGIPLSHTFRRQQQAIRGTDAVFVSDPRNPLTGINTDVLRTGLPTHAVAVHPQRPDIAQPSSGVQPSSLPSPSSWDRGSDRHTHP
ncbi:hypothetical protein [Streptomyces chartreusis]|uniref:hypothetical protein n=1 Tax=Streptomyces chartreusis TaxID=1969 RepID=UPI00364E2BEA